MNKKIHIKKYSIYLGFWVIFALLLQNLVFLYNNLQNKTPVIGLKLEGENITGLTNGQIQQFIQKEITNNNPPLKFYYQDKVIEVKKEDVGYNVNSGVLANQILQTGRQGNLLNKLFTQEKALLGLENTKITGKLSQSLLTIKILDIQDQINQDPQTISPDFKNDVTKILPTKNGVKVQVDKLTFLILNNIANPPANPLLIPTFTAFPNQHQPQELKAIQSLAPTLLTGPVAIVSGGQIFSLSPAQLKDMLTVIERPDPKNPKRTVLLLRLDDKKLNRALGDFAAKVEALTNAEFDDHEARVAIYSQVYSPKNRYPVNVPTGTSRNLKVLGASDKPGPKTAFLTFDDGPNSIYHPLILDILKNYRIQATFFLVGQNIPNANPAAIRTFSDGHMLGNHSYTHSFLPNLSDNAILNELDKTDNIIKSIDNNKNVTIFRPPYGGMNYYVKTDAHKLGLNIFLWDVDPRDWSEPSTDELVRRVVNYTRDGSNILLHSNHLSTVRALPQIIQQLQAQGYTFKTLKDYPTPEEY